MSQDLIPSQLRPWLWQSGFARIENSVFTAARPPYTLSSGLQPQKVWPLRLVINHSQPFLSLFNASRVASNSHPIPLPAMTTFSEPLDASHTAPSRASPSAGSPAQLTTAKSLQWYHCVIWDPAYQQWGLLITFRSVGDPTPKSYFRICFLGPHHFHTNCWRAGSRLWALPIGCIRECFGSCFSEGVREAGRVEGEVELQGSWSGGLWASGPQGALELGWPIRGILNWGLRLYQGVTVPEGRTCFEWGSFLSRVSRVSQCYQQLVKWVSWFWSGVLGGRPWHQLQIRWPGSTRSKTEPRTWGYRC